MADFATSIDIRATPEAVFEFLVTAEGLRAWLGQHAVIEPVTGGVFQVDVAGTPIRGSVLELRRPERVVLSWGVAGSDDLPAGSTTVSFTMTPTAEGTHVDLEHRGLPEPFDRGHADGWQHFLPRLRELGEGSIPADDTRWTPLFLRTT